ncbi:UDP-N-acetyl-D-glucosamine 2-epimerase, UDP-hydrolysing [Helicobacter sp. 13S00401-1]|uniref:UDP-N-acetylglucosamine 2-epimerase n=1 Tax=Helicobacter sp. 13S00401-1 TaxID=1905758 RepID=UPI000BA5C0F0|nr:UDP-N-acetylglucosamine 2-epimerase [Helicobacter sp. 13S00401-1]PAF51209.1 UDP-N-acetyl-D-glucosamine 2-epimerase, UDP-hydrolysing [Helicobacter sp. 13S00401-1]
MKKIVFLTGSRAEYGKLKPLIKALDSKYFKVHIFVCGMHLLRSHGFTYMEIYKDGFEDVFLGKPYKRSESMDLNLSHTIADFSKFVRSCKPDMIVVHGDRLEALSGAIVGAFNNILVAHVEGGEVSGTIDESIRHAVSKLSHIHFVANAKAKQRLLQLGENENYIYEIGSPDIDIMLGENLPSLKDAKDYYKIDFESFIILALHPVTTDISSLKANMIATIEALKASKENFVVIYPNNDLGSEIILKNIKPLKRLVNFKVFPSIRFEMFLTLLKHAKAIVGNSSAGVREAPIFGTPSIDIGSRQTNRYDANPLITHIESSKDLLPALKALKDRSKIESNFSEGEFGDGKASLRFKTALESKELWDLKIQKNFIDLKWGM